MNIYHRLARLIEHTPDGDRWTFINGPLDESFIGIRDDGKTVVCIQGENYVPMKTSLRVRLHNWLINRGDDREAVEAHQ